MTRARRFDHLILDWNGTVVDDVDLAVAAVNHVRGHHGLMAIGREDYRRLFGFPIRSFYARMGFDLGAVDFGDVASLYLSLFDAGVRGCPLHRGVSGLIGEAARLGMSVSILSASHRDILVETVRHHGLDASLHHVLGLSDRDAAGKETLAEDLDRLLGHPGPKALLVGDTTHDRDIGQARCWSLALVSNGHQGPEAFGETDRLHPDLDAVKAWMSPSHDLGT